MPSKWFSLVRLLAIFGLIIFFTLPYSVHDFTTNEGVVDIIQAHFFLIV